MTRRPNGWRMVKQGFSLAALGEMLIAHLTLPCLAHPRGRIGRPFQPLPARSGESGVY